jgi:hypothetical protein
MINKVTFCQGRSCITASGKIAKIIGVAVFIGAVTYAVVSLNKLINS